MPAAPHTDCSAACNLFWQDAIARKSGTRAAELRAQIETAKRSKAPDMDAEVARLESRLKSIECHWHPYGDLLLAHEHDVMSPCRTASCCEWQPTPADLGQMRRSVDRQCNLRQGLGGNVVHTADSGYLGLRCETVPGEPCPNPTPTPGPTPSPGSCPDCPGITAIVGKVHQYQWQHQTVPFRQEGDVWVANGPVDKVSWDATVYYGCAAPRCDSEHDHCLRKCEDLRGPRYSEISSGQVNCVAENTGEDGRGFRLNCDLSQQFGEFSVRVCTVSPWISTETGAHIPGQACKTLRGRVD